LKKTFSFILSSVFLLISLCALGQKPMRLKHDESGLFSIGIRSGLSFESSADGFNSSLGMGMQFRIMPTKHINTEWFAESYHGAFGDDAVRTDTHIGGLVLLYPQRKLQRVAPFLAVGPNADFIKIRDRLDKNNFQSRWSIGAQAGIGFHINMTYRTDMTISTQYMLHFGQTMALQLDDGTTVFLPHSGSGLDGHLLFNVSINFKMADLWRRLSLH
jgi:hypothetical protein